MYPAESMCNCALCIVHCALCNVHCALCIVQCALCIVQCALCIVHCALCMCVFVTIIATFFAYYWPALEFRRVVKHVIGTLSALYWHALSTLSGRCWHVLFGQFWARCAVSTRKISLVQSPPG